MRRRVQAELPQYRPGIAVGQIFGRFHAITSPRRSRQFHFRVAVPAGTQVGGRDIGGHGDSSDGGRDQTDGVADDAEVITGIARTDLLAEQIAVRLPC